MEVSLNPQPPHSKPAVCSLKYHSAYDGFKKYHKKPKQALQLEAFMSELITDNPIVYDIIQKQDLDHFDRLKKLNQMHSLDVTSFKTAPSPKKDTSRDAPATKSFRPTTSISRSEKSLVRTQIKSRTNMIRNSFTKQVKSQERARSVKLRRSDILSDIQRRSAACLQKFIQNNQKKEIFQYVDELMGEVQMKSKQEIANLYTKSIGLEEEKANLQRELLELKYRICCLQRVQKEQATKINDLSSENRHLQIHYELLSKFSKDFEAVQSFQPGVSCRELIAHCKKMEQLCLNRMGSSDDTQLKAAENSLSKCKQEISSLKLSYNIVCNNLKSANQQVKERREVQNQEEDNKVRLLQTQQELKILQNRIVEFYNSWYQNRDKTIKGVLKEVGCFKTQYSYLQMIQYMQLDLKNLSTPCKVDEYLRKILATIQLAQRKVFPNVVPASKIDPCKIVNEIVNYTLSIKVHVSRKEKRMKSADKENEDMKYITEA